MSKLKIEHGASKINLVLLKTNIEDGISSDIDLMCQWSNNDRKYIVNELLRFALAQNEDFLEYKAGLAVGPVRAPVNTRSAQSAGKVVTDMPAKPDPASANHV
jgi:hypothetical protein